MPLSLAHEPLQLCFSPEQVQETLGFTARTKGIDLSLQNLDFRKRSRPCSHDSGIQFPLFVLAQKSRFDQIQSIAFVHIAMTAQPATGAFEARHVLIMFPGRRQTHDLFIDHLNEHDWLHDLSLNESRRTKASSTSHTDDD